MNRRTLLRGATSLVALSCAPAPRRRLGSWADAGLAARGHRLFGPPPAPLREDRVGVAIVGAGVAGLVAAWRLAAAGFQDVALYELHEDVGGTAISGAGAGGDFPWGAHYLTLPNAEARLMRRLLGDLGVITSFSADGRPFFDEAMVCAAPEERLFNGGRFTPGLWPSRIASKEATAQRDAFGAIVAHYTALRGADGAPAFAIPTAQCSQDPAIRALSQRSFSDWLDGQGLTDPVFRWWVEYGCRDDFGTTLGTTSAWAGLFYHCARRPDPAEDLDSHVLTWPGGNGWLIEQLRRRCPFPVHTGALCRAVEAGPSPRLVVEQGDDIVGITAEHVILAVPSPVAGRLLGAPRPVAVDAAPWRVAALTVDRPPAGLGLEGAWDTVFYGSSSLGYVRNTHQTEAFGGPCVLTWYEACVEAEVGAARRALLEETDPAAAAEGVLADLRPAHPDIDARVQAVALWRWGHGTVRPVVGLHDGRLDALAAPVGAVHFAHTDLSGLSLFEEAAEHGARAAEEVIAARLGAAERWR